MPHFFLIEYPAGDYQLCDADMPIQKNGLSWSSFFYGAKLKPEDVEEPILVELDYPEDVMPDIFISPLLIRDDMLADFLEFGIDNIDAYDCHLIDQESGKVWTNYKLCNIIGLLDVFDMNASKLHEDSPPEVALLFDDIVIDQSKADGFHIFRPSGCMTEIMVSEELKNYMESKGKCVNLRFVEPKDFA